MLLDSFSNMIIAIGCWIFLFTLCQCKYIEVNNAGNDNSTCCIEGGCVCGSFYEALISVEDDTVINITSSLVTLHNVTHMGSGHSNITIIGSDDVTVACNNTGTLDCFFCTNVVIKGITWDHCGDPYHPSILYAIYFAAPINLSIENCTFQHSKVCAVIVVYTLISGFLQVHDSRILYHHIKNSSRCAVGLYGSLLITDDPVIMMQKAYVSIKRTLFHHNGPFENVALPPTGYMLSSAALFCGSNSQRPINIDIESVTVSTSFGLGSNFYFFNTSNVTLQFRNVSFTNNNNGGSEIRIITEVVLSENIMHISSTNYTNNINGGLKILAVGHGRSEVTLYRLMVRGNEGAFGEDPIVGNDGADQGTGVLIILRGSTLTPKINVSQCNINDNIGDESSILYITIIATEPEMVSITSSNFTNNVGSALYLSGCNAQFGGYVLFANNSATRGAAIYLDQGSQIAINENSTIEFNRNVARQQGGALYIELSFGCPHNGIVITSFPNTSNALFTDNSAGSAGNSIYFNIPQSCDVITDTLVNNFNYSQSPELVEPPISTTPYQISLCSKSCNLTDDTISSCHLLNRNMLGQSLGINATVCDYFDNVSETVQFYIECIDCNNTYRLSNNRVLVHNGLFHVTFLAVDSNSDIDDRITLTLSLSSVLSDEYKQLTATVSIQLSSCQSGYVFDQGLQQCVCYEQSEDIIQCQQDYVEIRHGYWYGYAVSQQLTVSQCPFYYCDFDEETGNGYYRLPERLSDQCSSRRTGVACGECKTGYTLAYDSPDCINSKRCYAGMTIIMVGLTALYWIIVVALVFVLMQYQVSLGYAYGLLYFYSIVDVLLGSNLYITDAVFQLVTILSSFAKLTPQFLGKLCFVQGLSGIDQQFIHYWHAVAIFSMIGALVIAARWSPRIASIVSKSIIRVICLLILLSYTSLASTSLQLLRPIYFDEVSGARVYSSPSIKYFTGRHIPYGIIALLCELVIVLGLPLLLLLEPFLRHKVNFIKIKPLLDQYQESYKDQYHWFAAYYLICRQIIIIIVFISNFNNGLYYLQTACIIIVSIHVCIKPYKNEALNVLDGIILLMIVLVVNLNSFTFPISSTISIVVIVVILPLLLSCLIYAYVKRSLLVDKIHTWICKKIDTNNVDMPE